MGHLRVGWGRTSSSDDDEYRSPRYYRTVKRTAFACTAIFIVLTAVFFLHSFLAALPFIGFSIVSAILTVVGWRLEGKAEAAMWKTGGGQCP